MTPPTFTELNAAFNAASGYDVTNEECETLNALLGRRRFANIGAISSGGEVLLFVLGHRMDEKLVAVDHAYSSLTAAYLKILMLQALGPYKLHDLFLNGVWAECNALVQKVKDKLPNELQKYANIGLGPHNQTTYRREWYYGGKGRLARSAKKLDKMSFLHGDLSDLARFGEFDLLYVSNAHEHSNKDRLCPKLYDIAKLVRVGGLVLGSSNYLPLNHLGDNLKVVSTVRGFRTTWHYYLLERTQ